MAVVKIGVAIVTMNRPAVLRQTLEGVQAWALALQGEMMPVVIIDNGSAPTPELWPGWQYHRNEVNVGLSRAVNQGLTVLRREGCDVLVHMDDDALVQGPGFWQETVVGLFERNKELGLLLPNGGNYVEYIQRDEYRELRWGLGFCWAMRSSLYDMIGAYDPQLYHQQECDLALRVRMTGLTVGATQDWAVRHNDQGGLQSDLSKAREHIGVVQFRDKWCQYFRGAGWNYGTVPLYLMQHWPPDQEWFRRYGIENKVDLNPAPPGFESMTLPGMTVGLTPETAARIERTVTMRGQKYLAYMDIRPDFMCWARVGYDEDRQIAIRRWAELTGEDYAGYRWGRLPWNHQGS